MQGVRRGPGSLAPSFTGASCPLFSLGPGWRSFIDEVCSSQASRVSLRSEPTITATSGRDQAPHEANMTNPDERSKRKKKPRSTPAALPVIQPLVAGIDIGSTQHWVCGPPQGETPNVRVFGTT